MQSTAKEILLAIKGLKKDDWDDIFGLVDRRAMEIAIKGLRERVEWLDRTTREWIADKVSRAIELGWSPQELGGELAVIFDEDRAMMISRTETSIAHNESSVIAYRESGVIEAWEWLLSEGACDDCIALADSYIAEYPEGIPVDSDIEPPPFDTHPNCRCTTIPVIPERERGEEQTTVNPNTDEPNVNEPNTNEVEMPGMTEQDKNYTIEYHGTNMGDVIEKEGFKLGKVVNGRMLGNGVYTTSNFEVAQYYAIKSVEETGKGIPVVLQVRVPLAGKDNYFANYEGLIEFVMKARAEREGVNFYGLVDSVLDGIRARTGGLPFDVSSIYGQINAGKITNLEGVKQIWEKNKNEILDQYFKLNRNDFLSGKAVTESMRYKNVDNFSLFQWETTKKLTSSVTVTLDPTKVIVTKNRGPIRKSKRYTIAYTWGTLPDKS